MEKIINDEIKILEEELDVVEEKLMERVKELDKKDLVRSTRAILRYFGKEIGFFKKKIVYEGFGIHIVKDKSKKTTSVFYNGDEVIRIQDGKGNREFIYTFYILYKEGKYENRLRQIGKSARIAMLERKIDAKEELLANIHQDFTPRKEMPL